MKNVLVYPCGTEIGLEIYRAVNNSTHYKLYGGSCSYDHGRFVYKSHIDSLPMISDNSSMEDVKKFIEIIEKYDIDIIYPATDSVTYKFSQYRHLFKQIVVVPDIYTATVSRSKKYAYSEFRDIIQVPKIYSLNDKLQYPLFIKPDVGQGSCGAQIINNINELNFYLSQAKKDMLILEYLPGVEYTIDCFTNSKNELIFSQARARKRIKSGTSVNTYIIKNDERFKKIAQAINDKLHQRGGWFFQVKERLNGELVLLEIASRIAGTSQLTRANGVNLPLMTLFLFDGHDISSVINNNLDIEVDRALYSVYKVNYEYNKIFIDYDDTIILNGAINTDIVRFLYKSINNNCEIILITRHKGDLKTDLDKFKLTQIFDKVIHLNNGENKYDYITSQKSIFIDDSFVEREEVKNKLGIPVFSPQEIECMCNSV